MSRLSFEKLYAGYGASTVLHGLDLAVEPGEAVAIVGRNGAGKSTLLLSVFGETTIRSGEIRVGDTNLTRSPGYTAAKLGVSIAPQGRRILPNLTVRENLLLCKATGRSGQWDLRQVYDLFPILQERAASAGTMLSGGQQQMLAIGRALMAKPRLLLLDEPSMGLAPKLVDHVLSVIRSLQHEGLTILLVEQNAGAALSIADRAYVLETGKVALSGKASDVHDDRRVREVYLGI